MPQGTRSLAYPARRGPSPPFHSGGGVSQPVLEGTFEGSGAGERPGHDSGRRPEQTEERGTAGVSGTAGLDLGAAEKTSPQSLAERLFNLVARYGAGGDVKEGPQRSGDPESVVVLHVGLTKASPVEDAPPRAGLPEIGSDAQVYLLGEDIAEVVDSKGGLVGDDRLGSVVTTPAPERPADEVVMLRCGQVGKAVETAADPLEVAGPGVIIEMLLPIADRRSLLGGEVTTLERRGSVERSPSLGGAAVGGRHGV